MRYHMVSGPNKCRNMSGGCRLLTIHLSGKIDTCKKLWNGVPLGFWDTWFSVLMDKMHLYVSMLGGFCCIHIIFELTYLTLCNRIRRTGLWIPLILVWRSILYFGTVSLGSMWMSNKIDVAWMHIIVCLAFNRKSGFNLLILWKTWD